MFSSQGSTNSMLQNSTWNGNEGMVTLPVDSSVSQMQAFLYTNTDTINASYAENSLPIEKIENVDCAGPSIRPFTASNEPTQTLNTSLRSSLVPIQPSISTTEIRIRPQTTSEQSNISHEVLTIDELRSIESGHSVNTTDDTTNASNDSIRPSLNTSLRPAVIPIQPATTPLSGRPRCGRKRKAESPEEREVRTRERVLRNRHAAQMSRNKKRQQLVDLEEQNTALKEENTALRERHAAELTAHREENERLAKRVRTLETKLDDFAAEFDKFRSQQQQQQQLQSLNVLPSPEMIMHPLDGVRGSAVSVTLEHSPLASGNGKNGTVNIRTHPNKSLPSPFYRFEPSMHEYSKSQQRTVKLRSLYRTFSQIPSKQTWNLNQTLMICLIMLLTLTTGQVKCYPYLGKIKKMEFVDNVVISGLRRLYEKRRLRSVKGEGKRSRGPSNMKSGEYEWRKYPP
uniref:X-box-binding protein 1 n=1 Tax=Anthurium amnicola TaxID=1678845 RepID=A0A1D1YC08_9ARAE